MADKPKLPANDPMSEENEERRAERAGKIIRGEIPDPIAQAIAQVDGAKH